MGKSNNSSENLGGLDGDALLWYRRCVKEFRLVSSGELGTLQQAALCLSRIAECRAAIAADGMFVKGERGLVVHPGSREERQHRALFLQACRQLGISAPTEGLTDEA